MNAWEILSANATVLGNAWSRLNSLIDGGTIIRCPSGFMADTVLSLDMSIPVSNIDMSIPVVSFTTEPINTTFTVTPVEYTFSIVAPSVALEV